MCVLLLPVSWRVRPVGCEEFVNQDESPFFWTTTTTSFRVTRHEYEFQFGILLEFGASFTASLQWRWMYFVVEILCDYLAAKKKKKDWVKGKNGNEIKINLVSGDMFSSYAWCTLFGFDIWRENGFSKFCPSLQCNAYWHRHSMHRCQFLAW